MKGFRKKLTFPVLGLSVGLVVFSLSYTMLGQKTKALSDVSKLKNVVVSGDVLKLRKTLRNGADPNATDKRGNAALHWAISGSRVSSVVFSQVKELLAHGANPNLTNKQGLTPLHFAAMFGGTDAVASVLIGASGMVNVTNLKVGSPYEMALKMGNDGVASAISRSPGHVALDPKKESMLKSFGDYSRVLREGFRSAKTDEEIEGVVTKAVGRLVKSGLVGKTRSTQIREQLLERIKNNNCASCEGD